VHDRTCHVVTCSSREYAEQLITEMELSHRRRMAAGGGQPATETPGPASDGAHAGRAGASTLHERSMDDNNTGAPAAPVLFEGRNA